jgi:hypothetical protein
MCFLPCYIDVCFVNVSVVVLYQVVAAGQCVHTVLLRALFCMVTLKYSAVFWMVAVYFGLLIYAKNAWTKFSLMLALKEIMYRFAVNV